MKIVIQHGSVVNREVIELFLRAAPKSWINGINGFTVYASIDEPFRIDYYRKSKMLGIHISDKYEGTKSSALDRIAVALQAIKENGDLPRKMSKSKEHDYCENWNKLKAQG